MWVFGAEWGVGQVFLAMLWFFLFLIWIWLVVAVFVDVFHSDDLPGWAKALWVLFVIAFPFLGVLVYLIARGSRMQMRSLRVVLPDIGVGQREQPRLVLSPETVQELARIAEQRDQGLLTADEYVQRRAELLD
jgi:hypothetical protein